MTADITLNAGERILWTGEPQHHPLFDRSDLFLVPMSLFFLGFAVFWERTAMRGGAPGFFVLWGIPFILYGLYLVAGRLVVRALRLRSTTYTVTDRRVVEVSRRPFTRRTEAYLSTLAPPVVRDRPRGGTGSIAFGEFPGLTDAFNEAGVNVNRRRRGPRPIVLWHVSQPEYVRGVIAQAQR
ncbi:hypothetical protein ACQEVZ_49855 [Dactylosporangium sp. CA-152071]|uniref:hypothetical protein n=1 Tax=Dactylosporangium sp. CA-152071 TaxID=3239933 RepID=UPI003D8E94FC